MSLKKSAPPIVPYGIKAVDRLKNNRVFKVVVEQNGQVSVYFSPCDRLGPKISPNAYKAVLAILKGQEEIYSQDLNRSIKAWLLGLRNNNVIIEPGKISTGFRDDNGKLVFSKLEDIFTAVRQFDHILEGYFGAFGEDAKLIKADDLFAKTHQLLINWKKGGKTEARKIQKDLVELTEEFKRARNIWKEQAKEKIENCSLLVSPPGALAAQTLAIRKLVEIRGLEINGIAAEMLERRSLLEKEVARSIGAVVVAMGQIINGLLEAESPNMKIGKTRFHINKAREGFEGVFAPPFYSRIKLAEGYLDDAFKSADQKEIIIFLDSALRHLRSIDFNPKKEDANA